MVSSRCQVLPIYSKQADFRRSTAKLRGFIGGRGTGKTFIGGLTVSADARRDEAWVCVAPDYGVAIETSFPVFVELTQKTGQWIKDVKSPFPKVTFRTMDGGQATIVFRSGEKPEKLRGGNYAGAWLDEATVMPKSVFDLIRPTLRWRGKMGPILLTATPKGTRHWTFERFYAPVDDVLGGDGVSLLDGMSEDSKAAIIRSIAAGNVEYFSGKAYVRRSGSSLIRASTRDNPFLPPDFYETIRSDYGTMLAAQELEGEFVEISGLLFRREWFSLVDSVPREALRVRYWDQAATPGSGCFTAGVLMARDADGQYYIEHVVRGQWGPLERNKIIDQITASDGRKYGGHVVTFVEQEGGSAGKEVAAQMIQRLPGYSVFRDVVSGKRFRLSEGEQLPGEAKVVRAMPFAAQVEAGNVAILRSPWSEDYITELCAFPEWKYCDQVDASSGAFNKLASTVTIDPGPIGRISLQPTETGQRFGALAALHVTSERQSQWERMPWARQATHQEHY
ncbi:MAG: phage terminase large subunit [Pirellulaceae bacterium]|nr:phage terminase large subunit [Pirellulaceae bacterium]